MRHTVLAEDCLPVALKGPKTTGEDVRDERVECPETHLTFTNAQPTPMTDPVANLKISIDLIEEKKFLEALEHLNSIVNDPKSSPQDSYSAMNNIARCMFSLGENGEAITWLDKSIRVNEIEHFFHMIISAKAVIEHCSDENIVLDYCKKVLQALRDADDSVIDRSRKLQWALSEINSSFERADNV